MMMHMMQVCDIQYHTCRNPKIPLLTPIVIDVNSDTHDTHDDTHSRFLAPIIMTGFFPT
jgi:hypothetical protein